LLEERVGCALVIRGQPCEATETGRRLCQHVDRVRLLEHELQSDLPALLQDEQVWVNVPLAVNADSLATWFAKAMPGMAASAPVLLQLSVDDEGHTTEWLRRGSVLAAVTATEQPAAGCSSRPLGAMRYVAAASPALVARYFSKRVNADSLRAAPSLSFNAKDELQQRWVRHLCGRHVEQPRHALPSPQGFVAAALAGMGWGLHPLTLVTEHLRSGQLVELVPDTPLDVPLYWQQARAASTLLEALTRAVIKAASDELIPP
jgi:LysR family transcriptional regulator (chromosome initiation inhibitor)